MNKNFFEKVEKLEGQALHAQTLGFNHPTKNKWVNFEANLPRDIKNLLNYLENIDS